MALRSLLPAGAHVDAGEVMRWARSSSSQGWFTGAFLFALLTSWRFMALCLRTLGAVHPPDLGDEESLWRAAARSLLLLIVWATAFVVVPIFLLLGPVAERVLEQRPATTLPLLALVTAARSPLAAGVTFAAILLTYRMVARRRVSPARLTLAALLATLGWISTSLLFSRAVPLLWSATQVYGSLGSLLLFLIWAYLNAWVLLLGGFMLSAFKLDHL